MKKNAAVRQTNIELLRIFAMILITLHHYSLFSDLGVFSNNSKIMIVWGGKVGVYIFLLISGYFLVESKYNFKRVIKLYMTILFYSLIPFIILCSLNYHKYNLLESIMYLFPVLSHRWHFATTYLYLYLLSPFIVKIVKKSNKNDIRKFLLLVTLLFIIRSPLPGADVEYFSNIFGYIFIFTLGCYIKLYGIDFFEKNNKRNIVLIISIFILYFFVNILLNKYHSSGNLYFFIQKCFFFDMNSFITLFMSLLIFYSFELSNMKYNKIINFVSKSSFSVFLLQEHPLLRNYFWKNIFSIHDLVYNFNSMNIVNKIVSYPSFVVSNVFHISISHTLLLHALMIVLFFFIAALVIDYVRKYLEKLLLLIIPFKNKINNLIDKISNYYNI